MRFTAACVQLASYPDEQAGLRACVRLLEQAVRQGARLVVFPECTPRARGHVSREEAYTQAMTADSPFVAALREKARELGVYLAVNVNERGPAPKVFATTFLYSPRGEIVGRYSKHVLFGRQGEVFAQGETGFPVFTTDLGRVGLYVCMDGLIPEPPRCLAVQGAQILINCLYSGGVDEGRFHVVTRALENHVWVLSANKVGTHESGVPFAGESAVITPGGSVLAQATPDQEEVVLAEIRTDLADPPGAAFPGDSLAPRHPDRARRRPECYDLLVQPTELLPVVKRGGGEEAGLPDALRVGAVQVPRGPDPQTACQTALALCERAAREGLQLLVLPELFLFDREKLVRGVREAVQISQEALGRFQALATTYALHLALNLVEHQGGRSFSTLFLIGDQGAVLGRYRQVHLAGPEQSWATPGEELTVVSTRLGEIGLLIGVDALVPEAARVLGCLGADVILHAGSGEPAGVALLLTERAAENHCHVISAAPAGAAAQAGSRIIPVERYPTTPHWRIRWPETRELPPTESGLLTATLDPRVARDKQIAPATDLFRNRTPHSYHPLVQGRE
ncbi:MAG: carbon-nitrogen hydrolase family protein [Deltaproteobacteria bacterium]|nr:carbon-nitrogen hydrolase family protein [Deltaproteobacteria bacterium]